MRKLTMLFLVFIISNLINSQITLENHFKAVNLYNQGGVEFQNENYKEAIVKLKKVILLDPTYRSSYILLNHVLYRLGEVEAQKTNLTNAKAIFLEDDELHY
ncbi:hypothetical protein [Ascidiimonas sp. W6]|uniref:hypothetical protein n=1 Tax=Ascidiimonas meishanensis TaxID=3128903 RepID=UPI0030EDF429